MVAVPLSTVMASSPKPVMPLEVTASMRSVAEPVSAVMEEASMLPVVLLLRALMSVASSVLSERMMS